MTKWQEVLRHSVKGDTVKASALRKIPHLKSCPNWEKAEFLGKLYHKVEYAVYDGGLVKYDGRIYYVNSAQIQALRIYIRWNLKKNIQVLDS